MDGFLRQSGQITNSYIAVIQGESKLALGRERHEDSTGGVEVDVKAGDVIVVPAGVSHRSLTATDDYRYIGVYPEVCIFFFLYIYAG